MNKDTRKKMLVAMDFIARQMNNEGYIDLWFMYGVPDGMLDGSLDINLIDDDDVMLYDDNFAEMMEVFLKCMKKSFANGGLYCDGIISKED